jgi:hypothetical protein
MTDLALHPNGGPWICLPCKGETLEAARVRFRPAGAAPVDAVVDTTGTTTVEPVEPMNSVEDVDVRDIDDEDVAF